MSEKQHQADIDAGLEHKQMNNKKGINGQCLNRHIGGTPEEEEKNSCSHRWQAYLKMQKDKHLYNWDKYEKLSRRRRPIPVVCEWSAGELDVPKKGDWDIKGDNFWKKCYIPYWHEAHHVVPNSTLRNAIIDFQEKVKQGEKLINLIRGGLLKEKYNLNYQNNMIMLPMEQEVADAIGLPKHRERGFDFHTTYSDNVRNELKKIFSAIQQELVDHKNPKYSNLKTRIEALSESLYNQIINTSAAKLDKMDPAEFEVEVPHAL